MNKFMKIALQEARRGMRSNKGGPFGAVLVCRGKIIAKAYNQVLRTNDPTMHAEIAAIRKATKKLKRFDLSDCELYSLCEPCPMCFAAIHWAKIKKLFYACTRNDAAKIGFDDKQIYNEISGKAKKKLSMKQIERKECLPAFKEWALKKDKKMY